MKNFHNGLPWTCHYQFYYVGPNINDSFDNMNRKIIAILLVMLFAGSGGTNDILDDSVKPSKTLMNNSRYVDIMDNWNWSTVLVNSNGVSADDIATDSQGIFTLSARLMVNQN